MPRIAIPSAAVLALASTSCGLPADPGPDGVPEGTETVSSAVVAADRFTDYQIFLEVGDKSGYWNDQAAQANLRRGLQTCFELWQTALPRLQYRWASSKSQANFVFTFDNYDDPNKRATSTCPNNDLPWSGCQVATGHLYNDRGGRPFGFAEHTYVNRRDIYDSYVPATYPPQGYVDATNTGLTEGAFTDPEVGAKDDVATVCFHELAHTLGMHHYVPTPEDWTAWYGKPRRFEGDVDPPAQPAALVGPECPGLPLPMRPQPVPGKYFGSASSTPWLPALDPLHRISNDHMVGASDDGAYPPAGMTWPPTFKFNSRVIFPIDVEAQGLEGHRFDYPYTSGIIRMAFEESGDSGESFLTSDWSEALSKGQFWQADQVLPYYVVAVYPRLPAKPSLAAGGAHSLALRRDGTVWAWGSNAQGQLGDGSTTTRSKPVAVGADRDWMGVAAGEDFSVAIKQDGTLWSWGSAASGVLGNGQTSGTRKTPGPVCDDPTRACYGNRYVAVAVGKRHVLAVAQNGSLWAWGANGNGQLGDGTTSTRSFPTREQTAARTWLFVAAGDSHSLALDTFGHLFAWGANASGQLGTGDRTDRHAPVAIGSRTDWTRVVGGAAHTLAMTSDNRLWSWGSNSNGQLGRSTGSTDLPGQVQGEGAATDWLQIYAGGTTSAGLKTGGRIFTWGGNAQGQLGTNNTTARSLPGPLSLDTSDWTAFQLRFQHALAWRGDDRVWGWGSNGSGELGLNNTTTPILKATGTYLSNPPALTLGVPGNVRAGTTLTLDAQVSDNVSKVEFFRDGVSLGTDTTSPFSWSIPGATKGEYNFTAKATDRMGFTVSTPEPVFVMVHQISSWSSSTVASGSTIDLSRVAASVLDWIHFGEPAPGNETRKRDSDYDFTMVKFPGGAGAFTGDVTFKWNDGDPLLSASTKKGTQMAKPAASTAFSMFAETSTVTRNLRLYLRASNVDLKVSYAIGEATVTSTWTSASGVRAYTINSATSPSASSSAEVRVEVTRLGSGGNVAVYGAATF
jgi:alpha-tubulin suppressor-like RCC1 family protein